MGGGSDLNDGFDQIPVDGNEFCPIFVVDQDIGQADEQSLFFVDRVRDAVAHRGDEKIADIGAIDRSNADAYLFALRHLDLQSSVRTRLTFPTQELLSSAELLVFMLPHLLPAFLEHTSHKSIPRSPWRSL